MLDYTTTVVGNMNWVVNDRTLDFNNNVPDYLITVTFAPAPGAEYDYLWGTARAPMTWLAASATPIPGTLVLLGSALISLAGAGLRKKKLV